MTTATSSVLRPSPRQSYYYGVFPRLRIPWFLKGGGGLSVLVVLQTFSLLLLWKRHVDLLVTFSPLHLLLLIQCILLIACVLYLWQTAVFHISHCCVPSSAPDVGGRPSAAGPSSFASPLCSPRSTSGGASCVSARGTSADSKVAASTARAVASVSTRAPATAATPSSAANGAPAPRNGSTTTSTGSFLPRAVRAALASYVSRAKNSSCIRYVALLWKARRGSAAPHVEGSHVLITGGSKGIGLALAVECVRRGAALITLVARTASELEQAQKRCLAEGDACGRSVAIQVLQADLAAVDAVQEQLHRAMQLQGKIAYTGTASYTSVTAALASTPPQLRSDVASAADAAAEQENAELPATPTKQNSTVRVQEKVGENSANPINYPVCPPRMLFCNAAVTLPTTLETMKPAGVRRMVDTNLTSVVLQVQAVLPYMRKQQSGCICFSNTLATHVPIYGLSLYAGTKAALSALSSGLEQETAGTNIHFVNAYMPSVETPGFAEEKRVRPQLTGRLEGTVSALPADVVAEQILNAIEGGKRQVTFGVEGWLVGRCVAAFNAADTLAEFLSEVFLAGFLRATLLGLRVVYQLICFRDALDENERGAGREESKSVS